jgi:hypothetical protein
VAPATNAIRLQIGCTQKPLDLTRADLTDQSLDDQRLAQAIKSPYVAIQSKLFGRTTGRGDDLMSLQRSDNRRTTRAGLVSQTIQTTFFETTQPLTDSESARSKMTRNGRNGLTRSREKHHASSSVQPSLAALLPRDLLEAQTFFA